MSRIGTRLNSATELAIRINRLDRMIGADGQKEGKTKKKEKEEAGNELESGLVEHLLILA